MYVMVDTKTVGAERGNLYVYLGYGIYRTFGDPQYIRFGVKYDPGT